MLDRHVLVIGIDLRRFLQQRLRHNIILPRHPPEMRKRPHHQVPRIHAARRLALVAETFRSKNLRLDGRHDRLGNLALQRKYAGKQPVVTPGPDKSTGLKCFLVKPGPGYGV